MTNVKIENYTKVIKKRKILDNITIEFKTNTIYGLYGRNGSGKTMLLRAIAGLIYPTKGRVLLDEKILHKDIGFPEAVGVIIENTELLHTYDAYTNLKILSKIKKIATDDDINNSLEEVGLDAKSKLKVKAYSLGMKQKLSIAQAIFEKPTLLLLDEPTNALDEESVNRFRELLIRRKNEGTTIIIASHNKEDLKILCDEVIQVVDGQVTY